MNEDLRTYLQDHYAGGVGAIELLEHLYEIHEGEPLREFFRELLNEVNADHKVLHEVMTALGIEESSVRNAGAWMAEKFGRAKLGFGGKKSRLQDLQALEMLVMGITGKGMLWRALARVSEYHPPLQNFDFANLEQRALQQLARVEVVRLDVAKATLR